MHLRAFRNICLIFLFLRLFFWDFWFGLLKFKIHWAPKVYTQFTTLYRNLLLFKAFSPSITILSGKIFTQFR